MSKVNPPSSKQSTLKVWDIPTRLFHWALVILIFYAWLAVEVLEDMQQHFYAGYSILTLVLFRLCWGVFGTVYAKFSNFIYSPKQIFNYAKTLGDKSSKPYLGHNPLGGLAVLLMLFALLLQTSTGLFNSDDYFHGPLSGLVSSQLRSLAGEVHALNFNFLIALIALHIAAVLLYVLYKKQRLIKAMISGNKVAQTDSSAAIKSSKLILALLLLLVCAGGVYYIATGFTDTLPSSEYDFSY